ncbi:MAG TPA: fibronectin type III domain-containing protein [Bacteroidales bacterium]|nr:fibronectin type III domain-containing protein [Bacteroidales bacterium]
MKKIKFLLTIAIVGLTLIACKKEKAEVPTLKTHNISDIEQTVAKGSGEILSVGSSAVLSAGVCWDTNENPTINNFKTTDKVSGNLFISELTNLKPNTKYYVRAYAINGEGVGYGQQVSFRTLAVVKADIKLFSPESVTSGTIEKISAEIVSDGGSPITECGFVWGKDKEPSIEADTIRKSTLEGNKFSAKIEGMMPDSTYFIRAYAVSEAGVSYSTLFHKVTMKSVANEITITKMDSITDVSAFFLVAAKSADSFYPITERGVHWSLQTDSIVSDNHVTAVEIKDVFEVHIKGLKPNTKYFVMPYAKNKYGIKYGKETTFVTLKESGK